jgi:elongation factor P
MDTQTQSPSARGAATLVKAKVRNLRTDQVFDKSFKSGEKFNEPDLDKRNLQYLYNEGEQLVFMDLTSYEQINLARTELGNKAAYLMDNLEVKALFFDGRILDIELPQSVELEVAEVEPGTKGDTVQGSATKPATLENGLKVQVPLYIKTGDRIRVATKDGRFAERT